MPPWRCRGRPARPGPRVKVVDAANADIGYPTDPQYLEGPWMTKRDGRWYLFHAAYYGPAANQGYWTNVAYADSPLGPFTKDPHAKLFFGGHVNAFDGPDGRTWLSYRGENPQYPSTIGGPNVDPVDIDAGRVLPRGNTLGPITFPYQVTERFSTHTDSAWVRNGGTWSAASGRHWTQLATAPVTVVPGTAYHLKVVASGSLIRVYVTDMTTRS
ncbi:family 43 glycosylhydrolase [Dactylosporangium siamense]|uniref:Uncharacterized protein n=1 Tax=Dactylosporangium siamense TaxID=685454 RepID=A0A919PWM2_9ACTN|nr:family 43 glycosylhydrolase [Dactylosporangium siamense]GIG51637.1 hypothetical protein Dsi01nite_096780 [Dactylosporangium siamense]